MQNSAWIVLLRRIPPDLHNTLAIVTTIGIEINIQTLVRIEDDHVVIRGRLAGTTDTGRAFFVPYDQINYLGIVKEMKEPQVRALYGEAPPAEEVEQKTDAVSTESAVAQPSATEAMPVPVPPPEPEATPPAEPPKPAPQLKIPRKSGVLERLRARAQLGKSPAPPPNP
jgi:hypothetical protein